ncbi:MAG: tryptophan-rich sensory protein [Candidatus Woesearchaeota archaeon]
MKNTFLKIIAAVAFIAMVVVNYLANSLPINNRSTGAISDSYPNLFAPAGVTFSIWGLIYLLLAGYVLYQFISFGKKESRKNEGLLKRINSLFIISSIANISWIFAWHYDFIGLSVLIMAVLLIALIRIADILRLQKFSSLEKLFLSTPFSVYFGWITVATIANVTVFLVSIGWGGFGIADFIWTIIMLLTGLAIGIWRMNRDNSIAYGLVLIWAYLGILLKHLSGKGFDGQYPGIILTASVCLALFGAVVGRLIFKNHTTRVSKTG